MTETIEDMSQYVDADVAESAVIVRDPATPIQERREVTAAQAKVEAVASLTMAAYQKASQLVLTPEEIEKLSAEFPDEAFSTGAGGKENLIYIGHAHLRDRLNQVFKPGQWAIVPRSRWQSEFKTQKGDVGIKIYVEAMLLIRGCFVAEAVGDMDYFPHNVATNYGDAVEGAKSACLRRCCKELGIGLQAWKKEWCDGWWTRKRGGAKTPFVKPGPPSGHPQANKVAPTPTEAPKKATTADVLPPREAATEKTRLWMLEQLRVQFSDSVLKAYAIHSAAILPEVEELESWSLNKVPTTRLTCTELIKTIGEWERSMGATETGGDGSTEDDENQWFWKVIVPVPHRGQKRDEYLKQPDTIGSLYQARHENQEARSRLFGFLNMYEPKPWTNKQGKEMPPGATDLNFREALDAFGIWFEAHHPGENKQA